MRALIAVLLIAVCRPLAAQAPYLVKDINTSVFNEILSSSPSNFIRFGSRVVFTTTSASGVDALWSTDGTGAGTAQIAGINANTGGYPRPSHFVVLNGKVLFNATDSHGEELWTTDGTTLGTHLLIDIASGPASSSPGDRIVYHGQMIFAASDGVHGTGLWVTDGTSTGTRSLKDAQAIVEPYSSFALFKDAVYFVGDGALWKTDGSDGGTIKVTSLPWVYDLTATTFGLFFFAGNEPWVSDGTEAGTHKISRVPPTRTKALEGSDVTPFGDRVLFIGVDAQHGTELWISDGTDAGTHIVRDINPGTSGAVYEPFITVLGDHAFFATDSAKGPALWKTDGTEAGTTVVHGIDPAGFRSGASSLIAVGDKVYFLAGAGPSLWVTDGTAAGTHQVKGLFPSIRVLDVNRNLLTNIDGVLYFAGSNGVNGDEPWKSDGTDAGTSMIANLSAEATPSGNPQNIIAAGDWVYYDAWDGKVSSLWRSDGTPEGTLRLIDSPEDAYGGVGRSPGGDGRSLWFNKDSNLSFNAVWITEGTPETTAPADPLAKRFPFASYFDFLLGDTFFVNTAAPICCQNYNYPMFAAPAKSNAPAIGLGIAEYSDAVNLAGRPVYSSASTLSTTDGTLAGTYDIADLNGHTAGMAVMGGNVFFVRVSGNWELWRSDGTAGGTTVITNFPSIFIDALTPAERSLFFVRNGQLWVTDGTQEGTHSLPANPTRPYSLAVIGNRVLFRASDAFYGTELWISDGTAEGTHAVADLYPGPTGSFPDHLTSIGDLVYFSANHDLLGNELWVTDGTPGGTRLVADIEPGTGSSFPTSFVRAGNRIFFSATTNAFGRELWVMPAEPTTSLTIGDIRVAEGDSGDATARFTVTLSSPAAKVVTTEFATDDGTGKAGSDYEASAGKLVFAPGETSRNIDVRVHGNSIPENNRTFFLTLRNPTNAFLAQSTAYALIEDDDQIADVALALDLPQMVPGQMSSSAMNSGPSTATTINVLETATPMSSRGVICPCKITQLEPGVTAKAFTSSSGSLDKQQYFSATATAHQRDPHPANNSVAWMTNGSMGMDALYLEPGMQANAWISTPVDVPNFSLESSEPAIISVFSAVQGIARNQTVSFVAQAHSIGTAMLRELSNGKVIGSLAVDVVAAGTKPRWPGAIKFSLNKASVAFDQATTFTAIVDGTAPYDGATATGLVTIRSKGHELGRVTLTPAIWYGVVSSYLVDVGVNPITIDYAGDANFLPMTLTSSVTATIGIPTITVTSERTGASVKIHVRVAGSPFAAPTGTLDITAFGTQIHTQATLTTTAAGVAEAEVTVVDPGETSHAVHVVYAGDARYFSVTQDARTVDLRRHAGGR